MNPINRIDESGTAVVELNIFLPILVVPVLLLRDESFENDPHYFQERPLVNSLLKR